MGLECELKFLNVDLSQLSQKLEMAGGRPLGRYFESNLVFDRFDRSLKQAGILLRLREKQGKSVLTVKHPPDKPIPSALKVFEEIETGVDDFGCMKAALETVGFSVAFAYEKVREKWDYMDCAICLDRLPFGNYVEIEGTEETVFACADELGLDPLSTTKLTYHAINIEYRERNGLNANEDFVFEEEEKLVILKEMEKE